MISEFVERQEYKDICNKYNSFYNEKLNEIIKQIDLNELEIKDIGFDVKDTNNKPVAIPNLNDKELLSSLSVSWQLMNTKNTEEQKEEIFECTGIHTCICCKRIQFIMKTFRDLFLNNTYLIRKRDKGKRKQEDEDNVDSEFLDIFFVLFVDKFNYDNTNLIDDIHHISNNHLQSKLDYDQLIKYNACPIDNDFDLCIHDLVTTWREDETMHSKNKINTRRCLSIYPH